MIIMIIQYIFLFRIQSCTESGVAKVVRHWALDQKVEGSNSGGVAVFAFLDKTLNLDCLPPPPV